MQTILMGLAAVVPRILIDGFSLPAGSDGRVGLIDRASD